MKGPIVWLALITLACVTSLAGLTQEVGPRVATTLPVFHWIDETGVTHQLTEFAGYPVVLLPIYTRCPGPCLANVSHLKETLAAAAADPTQFRVLLFSFDPADTPEILTRYRSREKIPLGWSLGIGSPDETKALLEAVGFQYGKAGGEFSHPNMLLFLDTNLRLAKWIYGSQYSGRDFDGALKVAAGGNDWVGRHSDLLYALLLFALSAFSVALIHNVGQWFSLRRIRKAAVTPP
jgi:cytochrome oxidase Cu insertion factor (SCO1/SenC/PrrC family)